MTSPADQVKAIALESETTAETPMPATATPTRPNKSVPVAVRLSPDDVAAIEKLAGKLNVPTSSLIRGWIQQGLTAEREGTLESAVDRIAADVQRLREIVA
jgi:predicted nucleotide-binding protein